MFFNISSVYINLNPLAHIELDVICFFQLFGFFYLNPLAHIELDLKMALSQSFFYLFKSTSSYRARHPPNSLHNAKNLI